MNYVYGEEVILVNFIGDFIIAATVVLARNKKFSFLRCSAAGAIGVLYAFSAIIWSSVMIQFPVKILVSFAMAFFITKENKIKDIFLNTALLVFISFVAAGCTLFLSFLFSSSIVLSAGYLFGSGYVTILAGMIIGCSSVYFLYGLLNKQLNFDQMIYPCSVHINGEKRNVKLLADSGNLLRTISGNNVIVLENSIFTSLTQILKVRFADYAEYESYVRSLNDCLKSVVSIVFAQTIHSSEYLLVIKADEIRFENGVVLSDVYIASGNVKRPKGEFNGIFNPVLLKRRYPNGLVKKAQ